jgi:murein DD-endopeptidase MepM/ murein hydrolase activator NlpD
VTYAGTRGGYGRVVEIDHGSGFKTRYGHLNSISVKTGQTVAIGQKVGTMGSTGRSTGPHLHYEVYYRGKSYDPIKFLRAGKHVYEG